METGKKTAVSLSCKPLGIVRRGFELGHAERLLAIRDNGGWTLDDERFEYSEKNGIGRKQNKKRV